MTQTSEPPLVTEARRLLVGGMSRDEAAVALAAFAGKRREVLADAVSYWVRRMHQLPSDDFEASALLRVLEAALRHTPWPEPYSPPAPEAGRIDDAHPDEC
jgi:hypothetical protein